MNTEFSVQVNDLVYEIEPIENAIDDDIVQAHEDLTNALSMGSDDEEFCQRCLARFITENLEEPAQILALRYACGLIRGECDADRMYLETDPESGMVVALPAASEIPVVERLLLRSAARAVALAEEAFVAARDTLDDHTALFDIPSVAVIYPRSAASDQSIHESEAVH